VNGLSSRINVIEAASTLRIARRAIPVISVKTSDGWRSATTTLASASWSSLTLFIAGFRSLRAENCYSKPATLDRQ
jgi:hypothetical protein